MNVTYNRRLVLSRAGRHTRSARFAAATELAGRSRSWTRGFAVIQAASQAG